MRQEYPILEFDASRRALIEPGDLIKPEDIAPGCVVCFFQEVLTQLVESGRLRKVTRSKSELCEHPFYELVIDGKRLTVFHPGVGAPLAAGLLEEAIAKGFRELHPSSRFDGLADAARGRSRADWLVGMNFSRLYSLRENEMFSVGRVQTPVLAMIVQRDDEIRTFKPQPFWELMTRYRAVIFKCRKDRFFYQSDAQTHLERVQGHPLTITNVARKEEKALPPQLYDLTELQREMNRRFGLSADATLKAAQALYEAKLITYPWEAVMTPRAGGVWTDDSFRVDCITCWCVGHGLEPLRL